MKLAAHTAVDYAAAQRALLPPGAAWDWPREGFGQDLLVGIGQEPARLEAELPTVLQRAIDLHRPRIVGWHIDQYRRVAREALEAAGIAEALPRQTFAVGAHVGDRCWSASPDKDFEVPLFRIDHLFAPMAAGRHGGDGSGRDPAARCWSALHGRFYLLVRYYRSVVDPAVLWDALSRFEQAHVFLWFEDITGIGGRYAKD
jgi:hypothetical protein